MPDRTTLAGFRDNLEPEHQQLFLATTAWRVKSIHKKIYSEVKRYELANLHVKVVARDYFEKWVKRGEVEMRERAEEHEGKRVQELERFRGVIESAVTSFESSVPRDQDSTG